MCIKSIKCTKSQGIPTQEKSIMGSTMKQKETNNTTNNENPFHCTFCNYYCIYVFCIAFFVFVVYFLLYNFVLYPH